LKDYFQRFIQVKAKAPDVLEEVAIKAAIKSLRIGPFAAHLAKKSQLPCKICTLNLRSITDQTMTSAKD
jgi:hypothetical protein